MDNEEVTSSNNTKFEEEAEEHDYYTLDIKQAPSDHEPCEVKKERVSPWEAETGYITIKPETQTESFTSSGKVDDDMKQEGMNINIIKCEESTHSYEEVVKKSDEGKSSIPFAVKVQQDVFTGQSNKDEENVKEGGISHECNICSESFTSFVDIKSHKISHIDENPCKCDTCGEIFPQPGELRNHLMIHTSKVLHKCNIMQYFIYFCKHSLVSVSVFFY